MVLSIIEAVCTFLIRMIYAVRFYVKVMTPLLQDIQVNSRLWRKYDVTTGGLTWIVMCTSMSLDAKLVHEGNQLSTREDHSSLSMCQATPGSTWELTWLGLYRSLMDST
jgi:hypothetical protein